MNARQPKHSLRKLFSRMAAKFAVVRACRYYEVGIDSYTPLMVAWHKFKPICHRIFANLESHVIRFSQHIKSFASIESTTSSQNIESAAKD